MLHLLQWVVVGVSCPVASWLIVHNWSVFFRRHVYATEAPAAVPLLGGILGTIVLYALPLEAYHRVGWLPLLLDWGTVPGLCWIVYRHVAGRRA